MSARRWRGPVRRVLLPIQHGLVLARIRIEAPPLGYWPALLRNEVEFFYFHPAMDENNGHRVFAYCRTRGKKLGSRRQVVVVANAGGHDFGEFHLPWYWRNAAHLREVAPPTHRAPLHLSADGDWARLSLAPFQVRVFTT